VSHGERFEHNASNEDSHQAESEPCRIDPPPCLRPLRSARPGRGPWDGRLAPRRRAGKKVRAVAAN